MIRVTVELLPGGYSDFIRRPIGIMHLGNVSNLADQSDYDVTIMEAENPLATSPPRMANWVIRDHDRHQSVWLLVRAALSSFETADWEVL
jgi:hypothetical protein